MYAASLSQTSDSTCQPKLHPFLMPVTALTTQLSLFYNSAIAPSPFSAEIKNEWSSSSSFLHGVDRENTWDFPVLRFTVSSFGKLNKLQQILLVISWGTSVIHPFQPCLTVLSLLAPEVYRNQFFSPLHPHPRMRQKTRSGAFSAKFELFITRRPAMFPRILQPK
jgi:hypothetical protein